MTPDKEPPPCPTCGRRSNFDRCSHVECPKRKPVPNDPFWTHDHTPYGNGYIARPRFDSEEKQ